MTQHKVNCITLQSQDENTLPEPLNATQMEALDQDLKGRETAEQKWNKLYELLFNQAPVESPCEWEFSLHLFRRR